MKPLPATGDLVAEFICIQQVSDSLGDLQLACLLPVWAWTAGGRWPAEQVIGM